MYNKTYYTYIMSNRTRTVLYVGITGNLQQRYIQHLSGVNDGFTKRYKCHDLIYVEHHDSAMDAIVREKQIKRLSRKNKMRLIEKMNPSYKNLAEEWKQEYKTYVEHESKDDVS